MVICIVQKVLDSNYSHMERYYTNGKCGGDVVVVEPTLEGSFLIPRTAGDRPPNHEKCKKPSERHLAKECLSSAYHSRLPLNGFEAKY